ncbi:hypothetical protein CK203_056749 [Vitis vinifera]|uniref:Autophagy protein ATG5 UblA domain-containing protein n=1 Tax=Vitis vinifera TaxID=29760 RepID=A0A438GKH7_VITVI|nr:hypothetical protein CK203_056749 [Vitis vinifera]
MDLVKMMSNVIPTSQRHHHLSNLWWLSEKLAVMSLCWLLHAIHSSYRHIPTGVLFDLLCAEQERPWNLTV